MEKLGEQGKVAESQGLLKLVEGLKLQKFHLDVCMCVYVCVCVCIYIYVCVCVCCNYMHIYVCMYDV